MVRRLEAVLNAERPGPVRRALRRTGGGDVRLRRAVTIASLAGMASMTPGVLFQMGIVRHLPDPPLEIFDADKVDSADSAYPFGVPDGPVSLAAHALNIVLAAYGDEKRSRRYRWLPVLAASKAGLEALVAARFLFYEMPFKEKKICLYCIGNGLAHFAVFGLTLRMAQKALRK
jgi:uncharacterized membrane protein